jgi:hypothetical protein
LASAVIDLNQCAQGEHWMSRFAAIKRNNDDYRAHRSGGFGLRPPEVFAVRPGILAAWIKQREQLNIQHKVSRIITDQAVLGELRMVAAE